ncbi:hypothetical protein [Rodentibacter trehalosifermentans]|uniref:hypothetical protein n=1 Tax=Rodentibacter trehalosifermentans TaxID=1908263 RepID=UPI0013F69C7B|nr:hypothetical protein [Rodentibacter trehalosifermentans]
MKFEFLGVFKRIFDWFTTPRKNLKKRPHWMSKNAWSYVRQGKPTTAMQLYLKWSR